MKDEQLGAREEEETTVKEVGYRGWPQNLKGQKVWRTVANRVTCYRFKCLPSAAHGGPWWEGSVVQQTGGDAVRVKHSGDGPTWGSQTATHFIADIYLGAS